MIDYYVKLFYWCLRKYYDLYADADLHTTAAAIVNDCKASIFTEDGFTVVKPSSDSIQELLVVKQCDKY